MQKIFELVIAVGGINLIFMALKWAVGKYLKPLVAKATPEQMVAIQAVATLADDITDYLVIKFPNAQWDEQLDKGIDIIIEELGLKKATANRAMLAAISRHDKIDYPPKPDGLE